MTAVSGDPASCSRLGSTLRQLAAALRATARAAHDPFDRDLGDQRATGGDARRPGPTLTHARRRVDLLDAAATAAAREVDRIGTALQAHASDLAEALAEGRRLAERAEAAGLRVVDGGLAAAWGVSGVADGPTSARQEAQREELQSRLDAVAALAGQRRHRLAATLRESQGVLATQAGALRR